MDLVGTLLVFYAVSTGLASAQSTCANVNCQNGGTCFSAADPSSSVPFFCQCQPSYRGTFCETAVEDETPSTVSCADIVCQNGGICFSADDPSTTVPFVCLCQPPYGGTYCETVIQQPSSTTAAPRATAELCTSEPCRNGATCVDSTEPDRATFLCLCAPGFVGYFCDREDTGTGDCEPNPCLNDGLCDPTPFAISGFTCDCQHGFFGDRCQNSVSVSYDGCASSPCQNEGRCINQYETEDYYCDCLSGYSGRHCEVTGPCVGDPCQNGGTCFEETLVAPGYQCVCSASFYGDNCTEEVQENPCSPNPCINGLCFRLEQAAAMTTSRLFFCQCQPGFTGTTCQHEDPCYSDPCENDAECRNALVGGNADLVIGFWCQCTPDFVGRTCSVPAPCSSNPCLNDAECIDVRGVDDPVFEEELVSYTCNCLDGWMGQHCEFLLPTPAPLIRVRTVVRADLALLALLVTARAVIPERLVNILNGALCLNQGSDYSCTCSSGTMGTNCEIQSVCYSSPCQNGGTCYLSEDTTAYVCLCASDFQGDYCEERMVEVGVSPSSTPSTATRPHEDQCSSYPCAEGSTCVLDGPDPYGVYTSMCLCPDGFTGVTCAVELPRQESTQAPSFSHRVSNTQPADKAPCSSDPCLNGGTCADSAELFVCLCPTFYVGEQCQTDIRDCSYNGDIFREGQSRNNGCGKCPVAGHIYMNNETWTNDCNTCFCQNGAIVCTNIDCSTVCLFEGRFYNIGEQRDNHCSTCLCQFGRWYCADIENCVDNSCMYGSTAFDEYSIRPQHCNLCTCERSTWSCTTSSCDDYYFKTEVNRRYFLGAEQLRDIKLSSGGDIDFMPFQFSIVKNSSQDISPVAVRNDIESKQLTTQDSLASSPPVSPAERSRSIPAHFRFKNPYV
ncbi:uncharacterized protein [Diadema setosum]|uniref:uncharacterized protein n=1 Tax=Diadema setosum TaxID=31175 RepID=UPI003B3ADBD9